MEIKSRRQRILESLDTQISPIPEELLFKTEDRSNIKAFGEKGKEIQKKLYQSSILVLGSDTLAQKVLSCLVGLSYGTIHVMDNKEIKKTDKGNFLYFKDDKLTKPRRQRILESLKENKNLNKSRVNHIAKILREIKENNIKSWHSPPFSSGIMSLIKPNIIIDATNDPYTKKLATSYSQYHHVPFISISSTHNKARLTCYYNGSHNQIGTEKEITPDLDSLIHKEFEGKEQGIFTSSIIAGLAAEEARKFTTSPNSIIDENLLSNQPLDYKSDLEDKLYNLSDKKVLVIGAGGIGHFATIDLALLGVGKIILVDQKSLKKAHRNRLNIPSDIEGRKAEVLNEYLKRINPGIRCKGIYARVGKPIQNSPNILSQRYILLNNFDAIFGCVDNVPARIWLDKFSQKHSIPYIDGGVNVSSGNVIVYNPGHTKPLGSQRDLDSKKKEDAFVPCDEIINPSIINPNMIIGGAMVEKFIGLCEGKIKQKPFIYDSTLDKRIVEV